MKATPILAGRSCGSCTLCCKVLAVDALKKGTDTWCSHCVVGRGCAIYEDRPADCRTFHCNYLTWDVLGPHWHPARSKMVVVTKPDGQLLVHVDSGRPGAWLEEPYYSEIKRWAAAALARQSPVCITTSRRTVVVLPDRDVDLGILPNKHRIIVAKTMTSQGLRYEALALHPSDPRIDQMKPGTAFAPPR